MLDDIWIISSNLSFAPQNPNDIFFIARSVYHGPTYNGYLEVIEIVFVKVFSNQ